jgi:hypothetical protein
MRLVSALNAIHPNVWAIWLIILGVVATCCDQKEVGGTLVTGGFAVFRGFTVSNQPNHEQPKG